MTETDRMISSIIPERISLDYDPEVDRKAVLVGILVGLAFSALAVAIVYWAMWRGM